MNADLEDRKMRKAGMQEGDGFSAFLDSSFYWPLWNACAAVMPRAIEGRFVAYLSNESTTEARWTQRFAIMLWFIP
jgi:hypothetical protein